MLYLGIDVGIYGAFALLKESGSVYTWAHMPLIEGSTLLDEPGVVELLTGWVQFDDVRASLERPVALPKMAAKSAMKLGEQFGFLKGVLSCLKIPYECELAKPGWQRRMFRGLSQKENPKVKSIKLTSQIFPTLVSDLKKIRNKEKRIGVLDALLIAEDLRRTVGLSRG